MNTVLPIVAFGVAIFFAAFGAYKRSEKTKFNWSEAANQLGLGYTPGGLISEYNMSGEIEGYNSTVHTYTVSRGSGQNKSRTTYTKFQVFFPQSLDLGLVLKHESAVWGKVAKLGGAQDIQLGHSEFDSAFTIKGHDENEVRSFLTEDKRRIIMDVRRSFKKMVVTDQTIELTHKKVNRDARSIVHHMQEFTKLAKVLAPPSGETAAEEEDTIFSQQPTTESMFDDSPPDTESMFEDKPADNDSLFY